MTALAPRVHDLSTMLTEVLGVTDVGAYFPHRATYPRCCAPRITPASCTSAALTRQRAGVSVMHLAEILASTEDQPAVPRGHETAVTS